MNHFKISHPIDEDLELSKHMAEVALEQQKNMVTYKMEELQFKKEKLRFKKMAQYLKLLNEEPLSAEKEEVKQFLKKDLDL